MYEIIKNVIDEGRYDLGDLLNKIDTVWLQGQISDEQKEELVKAAQDGADFGQSVQIMNKLQELDKRVIALERQAEELIKGEPIDLEEPVSYPEYVVGKWYYANDKITFNGKKYICTAPENMPCTWSPAEYPPYWQEIVDSE